MRIALIDPDPSAHFGVRQTFVRFALNWTLESYFTPQDAFRAIPLKPPQVALLEPWVKGHLEIRCIRTLKSRLPGLPVLMFSHRSDTLGIVLSLEAGADGYLIRPLPPEEFLDALTKAGQGATVLCRRSRNLLGSSYRLGARPSPRPLTPREREITGLLVEQFTNKEIAEKLAMKVGTLHVHLVNIFSKLDVHTRGEACRKYLHS